MLSSQLHLPLPKHLRSRLSCGDSAVFRQDIGRWEEQVEVKDEKMRKTRRWDGQEDEKDKKIGKIERWKMGRWEDRRNEKTGRREYKKKE